MSLPVLRREAGARSFERGESYFKSGKVSSLVEHEGTLAAKVQGTRSYRVKLFIERKRIRCDCNCPLGQGGVFCKHGVAAGLAWLQAKPGRAPAKRPARSSGATMEDIRAWLLSQGKSTLAGMLMEQAMDDDKLRRRLLLTVAKKSAGGPDLDTYRKAIDQAVNEEVEDYEDVYNYASGIGEGIDSIEELLKEGRASDALELTEYAFQVLEGVMESVDDSDGHVGGLLERLQDIHPKACRKSKPDPVALAGRLFEWELRGNWGAFHGAAKTYASLAAHPSLEPYRTLKRHAGKAGRWKEWRLKAVEFLRHGIANAKATHTGRWAGAPPEDHSELVRILLWEKDMEAAWREAKAGDCSHALWLQLTETREKVHLADALPIYQRLIEPTLGPTNNEAYSRAVALLRKVQGLMGRLGKKKEFGRYLESVRAGNRQKRNFIKMLDRRRWK